MDYKEMYFKLFSATEESINILIKAQKECEELYMEDDVNDIQNNDSLSL